MVRAALQRQREPSARQTTFIAPGQIGRVVLGLVFAVFVLRGCGHWLTSSPEALQGPTQAILGLIGLVLVDIAMSLARGTRN